MYGLAVIEVMTMSGHLSNIDEISIMKEVIIIGTTNTSNVLKIICYYSGPRYINFIASLYLQLTRSLKMLDPLFLSKRDHVDPSQLLSLVETSYLQYV